MISLTFGSPEIAGHLARSGDVSRVNISNLVSSLLTPSSRGVDDVAHQVTAVGSRDVKKAQTFIDKFITGDAKALAKAYGSYEEVAAAEVSISPSGMIDIADSPAHQDVDAIYIGPRLHH